MIRREIKVTVEGFNQVRLLNTLSAEGVKVRRLTKSAKNKMFFSINYSDSVKTFAILDKFCYTYSVKDIGLMSFFKTLAKRCGAIFGLAIGITLLILASYRVWKIQITGNETIESIVIERALAEKGIKIGAFSDFDCQEAISTINGIEGISSASVYVTGTTLWIEVIESTVTTPENEDGEIFSLYDCQITRIITEEGEAVVKVGDKVKKGDKLISSIVNSTADEPLRVVNPKGKVYGKVAFSFSKIVSATQLKEGEAVKMVSFSLFGQEIFGLKDKTGYRKTVIKKQLSAVFPLTINYISFLPENPQIIDVDIEQIKTEFLKQTVNDYILLAGGSEIKEYCTSEQLSQNIYRLTAYIEAELQIGEKII